MIPTAAYIRVSTTEQKMHGLSLSAQRDRLTEYAKKHNLDIVEWYCDEGVSGRKLIKNRPELQHMIRDKDKFRRIIFIKLDRFFRSVAEYHKCMEMLGGIEWTATEEEYDLTTANGRMLVNMKLTIAELEADQTGERIKLVNEYKVKEGLPLTKQPFYFKTVPDGRFKRIEKNNEERLLDLVNHFRKYQSLQKTARFINEKYNTSYQPQYIKKILRDTRLYGEYKGNPDYYPAYMSRDEWDRLQEILPKQIKINSRRTYLFAGIVYCSECGRKMCGRAYTGRNRCKSKGYECKNNRTSHRCSNKHVFAESKIEAQLLEMIEPEFEKHKRYVAKDMKEDVNIAPVQEELKRLNYSWQKGRIDIDEYDRRYADITARLEAMQRAQSRSERRDLTHIDEILNSDWKTVYAALDDEHRQAFWRSIVKEIRLDFDDTKRFGTRVAGVVFND